jgi:phosphotransferase system HPr-like phosphotransfer protein
MYSRTITVASSSGLHVGPAQIIAQKAAAYDKEILTPARVG